MGAIEREVLDSPIPVQVTSGLVTVQSFSGTGVLVNSGVGVVTSKLGDTTVLVSGFSNVSTHTYHAGFTFLGHDAATIMVADAEAAGSGSTVVVRGHALSGVIYTCINSGVVHSGLPYNYEMTSPYTYVEVGTTRLQDAFSSAVTVVAVRR